MNDKTKMIKKCKFEIILTKEEQNKLVQLVKEMKIIYNQTLSILIDNFEGNFELLTLSSTKLKINQLNEKLKLTRIHQSYIDNSIRLAYKKFILKIKSNQELEFNIPNYFKMIDCFIIDRQNQTLILPDRNFKIKFQNKGEIVNLGLSIRKMDSKWFASLDLSQFEEEMTSKVLMTNSLLGIYQDLYKKN